MSKHDPMCDSAGTPVRIGQTIEVIKGDGKGRRLTVRAIAHGAVGRRGWSCRADDGDPSAPDSLDGDWTWSTWIQGRRFRVIPSPS